MAHPDDSKPFLLVVGLMFLILLYFLRVGGVI